MPEPTPIVYDSDAVMGRMPQSHFAGDYSPAGKAGDGSIRFSVNAAPVFDSAREPGNLLIENPESGNKFLVAEIFLDRTGELLYRSGIIPPGSYIPQARLQHELQPGVHPATVFFYGFNRVTQRYVGRVAAELHIAVKH